MRVYTRGIEEVRQVCFLDPIYNLRDLNGAANPVSTTVDEPQWLAHMSWGPRYRPRFPWRGPGARLESNSRCLGRCRSRRITSMKCVVNCRRTEHAPSGHPEDLSRRRITRSYILLQKANQSFATIHMINFMTCLPEVDHVA